LNSSRGLHPREHFSYSKHCWRACIHHYVWSGCLVPIPNPLDTPPSSLSSLSLHPFTLSSSTWPKPSSESTPLKLMCFLRDVITVHSLSSKCRTWNVICKLNGNGLLTSNGLQQTEGQPLLMFQDGFMKISVRSLQTAPESNILQSATSTAVTQTAEIRSFPRVVSQLLPPFGKVRFLAILHIVWRC
jgi:hypothetical protein